MKVCTVCGAKWRGEPTVCPLDGGPLEDLPDPLLGRTIGGRYVITERIGAGGMGTVYRAKHEVVGRDVAIKFLGPDLAVDVTNRRRFLREAKAANRIDHEHIIDITDYGETDDGLVYLVMEYLDGEPLGAMIDRGPIEVARAVNIAMQMAGALARAHELDVIHRDIKPDNVFLLRRSGGADFVKLLDFGLAKMKGEIRLTASGAVFGTPEYMAPEQARGAPLTGKADLYALGCVLYEMVVGQPPFSGATPDLILKHIREVPVPPSSRAPGIPPDLDALIMRLLDKDPARRHSDAYHLNEELRKISEELPRVSGFPTIRNEDFERALATELRAREVPSTVSSSAEAWDKSIERFRVLMGRAHPAGAPTWLTEAVARLEGWVGELARRRADLDRSASAVMQSEEEIRNARLRIGRAIDVLGRDESRTLRHLDELAGQEVEAEARVAEVEVGLRERWDAAGAPSLAEAPLELGAMEKLRELGVMAGAWVDARAAHVVIRRDFSRRERDRDDLRFQIAQLKGRLGTLSAEGDLDLDQLRDRTRRLDAEVQDLLDRIASSCEQIVQHFLQFPELREAVREAHR